MVRWERAREAVRTCGKHDGKNLPGDAGTATRATGRKGRTMNLLLITGAPRSGTTAVGYNLALPRSAGLLYEPFNYRSGLLEIQRPFEIPGAGGFTEARLDDIVARIRKLDLRMKNGRRGADTPLKVLAKRLIGGRSNLSYILCRLNPLLSTIVWKDPMAVFTSREVALRLGITVLATVRPPAAVAASYTRLSWKPDVSALIRCFQEKGWHADIPAYDGEPNEASPAIRGAMIWTMVYRRLIAWSTETDRLHLINVQDIVDDPVGTYRDLYALCGLPWSERIQSMIGKGYARRQDRDDPQAERLPKTAHVKNRDLSRINEYGKRLLTQPEKDAVAAMTDPTWRELRAVCERHLARIRHQPPAVQPLVAAS